MCSRAQAACLTTRLSIPLPGNWEPRGGAARRSAGTSTLVFPQFPAAGPGACPFWAVETGLPQGSPAASKMLLRLGWAERPPVPCMGFCVWAPNWCPAVVASGRQGRTHSPSPSLVGVQNWPCWCPSHLWCLLSGATQALTGHTRLSCAWLFTVWGGPHSRPCSLTLYVSQFLKKLTEPSSRLWMTVQPPGSCLWSHHTCMRRLVFSGFTR